jgi:hypothetical protein
VNHADTCQHRLTRVPAPSRTFTRRGLHRVKTNLGGSCGLPSRLGPSGSRLGLRLSPVVIIRDVHGIIIRHRPLREHAHKASVFRAARRNFSGIQRSSARRITSDSTGGSGVMGSAAKKAGAAIATCWLGERSACSIELPCGCHTRGKSSEKRTTKKDERGAYRLSGGGGEDGSREQGLDLSLHTRPTFVSVVHGGAEGGHPASRGTGHRRWRRNHCNPHQSGQYQKEQDSDPQISMTGRNSVPLVARKGGLTAFLRKARREKCASQAYKPVPLAE